MADLSGLMDKIYIFKSNLEDLKPSTFLMGQVYNVKEDTNEIKLNIAVGGVPAINEWYSKDDPILIPLSEVAPGFYIRDINTLTSKQHYYIFHRYKEYLQK